MATDVQKVLDSLELFATKVMPWFKDESSVLESA